MRASLSRRALLRATVCGVGTTALSTTGSATDSATTGDDDLPPGVRWNRTYLATERILAALSDDDGFLLSAAAPDDEAVLVRVDDRGEPQWHRRYEGRAPFDDLARLPDGDVVAVNTDLVGRFGPRGTPKWLRETDQHGNEGHRIAVLDDGRFVVAVNEERPNAAWVDLLSFDADDGTVLDERTENALLEPSLSTGAGGDLYVATESLGRSQNGQLLKLGADGAEAWRRTFAFGVEGVTRHPHGGVTIAGERTDAERPVLVSFDADGEERWRREFDPIERYRARRIETMPDGGFAVVGDTGSLNEETTEAAIHRCGEDGRLAWRAFYPRGADDVVADVATTADGILLVGATYRSRNEHDLHSDAHEHGWAMSVEDRSTSVADVPDPEPLPDSVDSGPDDGVGLGEELQGDENAADGGTEGDEPPDEKDGEDAENTTEGPESDDADPSADGSPGFGIAGTAVGIVTAAASVARRVRDNDE